MSPKKSLVKRYGFPVLMTRYSACGVKASRMASTMIGNIQSRYFDFIEVYRAGLSPACRCKSAGRAVGILQRLREARTAPSPHRSLQLQERAAALPAA